MSTTYEDVIANFEGWMTDAKTHASFADYQGFNEAAIYEAMGSNRKNFALMMVVCVGLRNSCAEKKLKKRSADVMKLINMMGVKARVVDGNTVTLTRIAVCFPFEYLATRKMLIESQKVESYPGMEDVPIDRQDFIALNFLRTVGVDGTDKIYERIKSIVKITGGGEFKNIPNMKSSFAEKIKKSKLVAL